MLATYVADKTRGKRDELFIPRRQAAANAARRKRGAPRLRLRGATDAVVIFSDLVARICPRRNMVLFCR